MNLSAKGIVSGLFVGITVFLGALRLTDDAITSNFFALAAFYLTSDIVYYLSRIEEAIKNK